MGKGSNQGRADLHEKENAIATAKAESSPKLAGSFKHIVDRLFTEEDDKLMHKTLGLLSLCNFFYRYFYLYPTTGSLGYEHSNMLNHVTMTLHLLLSTSSLIFHVIRRRLPKRPLIIYEEYRLHAILFSCRACMPYYLQLAGLLEYYPLGILAVHLMVDQVTRMYGTPGVTAVRVRNNSKKPFVQRSRLFFSFYQIVALASHLSNRDLANQGFNALIAIQSSAFLMTLFRKAIISWKPYIFWYGLALALSEIVMFRTHPLWFFPVCAFCFGVRMKGVSKYAIWGTYYMLHNHMDLVLSTYKDLGLPMLV